MSVPVAVTAVGLCLIRWWPYLLAAAGLMAVPGVISEWEFNIRYPVALAYVLNLLPAASYILAIIGVLACAQGLYRASPAWSAVVVAAALGSRLMGSAMMAGSGWVLGSHHPAAWHTALLAAGLAGLAPAAWLYRKGDQAAVGPAGGRPRRRARLIAVGTLAALVPVMLALLTMQGMASLLGTTWDALCPAPGRVRRRDRRGRRGGGDRAAGRGRPVGAGRGSHRHRRPDRGGAAGRGGVRRARRRRSAALAGRIVGGRARRGGRRRPVARPGRGRPRRARRADPVHRLRRDQRQTRRSWPPSRS